MTVKNLHRSLMLDAATHLSMHMLVRLKIWDPTASSLFTCLELLIPKKISYDINPKKERKRKKITKKKI